MQATKLLRSLGLNDFRNVQRDQLLGWLAIIPLVYAIMIRLIVPAIESNLGFDISPWYPVLNGFFAVLVAPVFFGLIIGFLLLDERDDGTMLAMQVSPVPLLTYLAAKILMPTLLSLVLAVAVYAVAGLAPLDIGILIPAVLVAALEIPVWALALAAFANNKVEGFALMKGGAGLFMIVPIGAYFVDFPWQVLFGILPAYWPMKMYWEALQGNPIWPYVIGGIVIHVIAIVILLRVFKRKLARTGV